MCGRRVRNDNKSIFNIGQPDIIGPWVAADRDQVRALIVGTIDEDAAHPHVAHLGEGDLGRALVIRSS
jgi:hypothetical protein